ncbi:hypothetical protein CEUSTIGMA_g5902.t1 [Chlamydomonas eustigma]|uniref:Glycoside hydrolase family 125 protein n=1 Tax=Chlamydomonas eustigma TaxID=1157962 RepID=A0A250X5V6_9CHLO|nr:hypothetical protein CEUSTIGMA_g5902.t1 [Chlamydomonas eustigma]|eukprot:GAX78463.1 hypothetical protein CEUSTIGMA_g5902.t1 [Chlamydomonas eustigma]
MLPTRHLKRTSRNGDRIYLIPMLSLVLVLVIVIIWVGNHHPTPSYVSAAERFHHQHAGKAAGQDPSTLEGTSSGVENHHSGHVHSSFAFQGLPMRKHVEGLPEIWARGPPSMNTSISSAETPSTLVNSTTLLQLKELCGRCLYRTLTSYVRMHDFGRIAVVLTGDIPAMWTRDSAVQVASYLPRVHRRPALRTVVEGAIRAQAYFILQDPWANAYNPTFVSTYSLPKQDRILGRGGWVWTRNFELDSVAYFFNFLWNYHQTKGLWSPSALLSETGVHDAVVTLLQLLEVEQHHEERSPYRYSELKRDGLGPPCGYTGMIWSAFRPSDDPQTYSFNIPSNMYTVGALHRLLLLNAAVWQDPYIHDTATRLSVEIHEGIKVFGIVEVEPGIKMYAYEVDGLGGKLVDFDDPNLPSLLAIPLLGYDQFEKEVYSVTRDRILSKANNYYYEGKILHGMGSPHTSHNMVWPLATAVEALTTNSTAKQSELLKMILEMASGNGLVHESVNVDTPQHFTRAEFGWANAMAVVAVEQLLGVDCDEEAERHRLKVIMEYESKEPGRVPNGGQDSHQYYSQLEASIPHV